MCQLQLVCAWHGREVPMVQGAPSPGIRLLQEPLAGSHYCQT